jgi:hypothetical protein
MSPFTNPVPESGTAHDTAQTSSAAKEDDKPVSGRQCTRVSLVSTSRRLVADPLPVIAP